MNENKITPVPGTLDTEETPSITQKVITSREELKGVARIWEGLVRMGLGESTLRVVTSVVTISLILIVLWIMGNFYLKAKATGGSLAGGNPQSGMAASIPTATQEVMVNLPSLSITPGLSDDSAITRLARLHTILPTRPRFEVISYVVLKGDTIYGIAEKFNLKPQTILWGNVETLAQDPDLLQPGQSLNILPVDGAYRKWVAGEGLNAVAKYYSVTPDDIISWPGNHLTPDMVTDLAHPNIQPGTMLVIPGGHGEFSDWTSPLIPRDNPAVAFVLGPGACGAISIGAIGTGSFVWPSVYHYLSGYPFDPSINHFGIDVAGMVGTPIYATDGGVVVYAGWNNYGYGNMIVIDHGTGWQSLYGHLSLINVTCGQSVSQGDTIAGMGSTGNSTGPHLHFELRSATYDRASPIPLFIDP